MKASKTGRTVINQSPEAIDTQSAKVMSEYFKDDPKKLVYLLESYLDRLKGYAKRAAMPAIHRRRNPVNWVRRKWRQRAERLEKLIPQVEKFRGELRALGAGGGELEDYLLANMEELSELFINLPVRKREFPYYMIFQGMPQRQGQGGMRFAEGVYHTADGLMMRIFSRARTRLTYETIRRQQRQLLGQGPAMIYRTTSENVRSFQQAVRSAAQNADPEEARTLLSSYQRIEDVITHKVAENLSHSQQVRSWDWLLRRKAIKQRKAMSHLQEITQDVQRRLPAPTTSPSTSSTGLQLAGQNDDIATILKQVLFSPRGTAERATSDTIWETIPVEKVFGIEEIGETPLQTVRRLSQPENADELDKLWNALKVLVYQKTPGRDRHSLAVAVAMNMQHVSNTLFKKLSIIFVQIGQNGLNKLIFFGAEEEQVKRFCNTYRIP